MNNQPYGRRPEDGVFWKAARDFWPILLAIVSIISMYSHLESRVSAIERLANERGPILNSHEVRITRVETMSIGWDKRLDGMETKLDQIYAKVR